MYDGLIVLGDHIKKAEAKGTQPNAKPIDPTPTQSKSTVQATPEAKVENKITEAAKLQAAEREAKKRELAAKIEAAKRENAEREAKEAEVQAAAREFKKKELQAKLDQAKQEELNKANSAKLQSTAKVTHLSNAILFYFFF